MTRQERRLKLDAFGSAPVLLARALRQFPKKMWMYKVSAEPGASTKSFFISRTTRRTPTSYSRLMIAETGCRASDV